MELSIEKIHSVSVIRVPLATLDASSSKAFRTSITPLLAVGSKVVLDLSQLKFVDSSGLGAMLFCLRQLHGTGGDLRLCGMTKSVRALFELVRMHRVFQIFNTREEAAESFETVPNAQD
jgi:anti-sigma B factor antagonist